MKRMPIMWAWFRPTFACNACCATCYKDKFTKKSMSYEMIDECLNIIWAQAKIHKPDFFMITALGGEPILVSEKIKYIWDHTYRILDPMGINTTYTFYTNGDFVLKPMSEEVINLIKRTNVIVFNIRDLPTDEIKKRLRALQEHGHTVRITAVMDQFNMSRIKEIVEIAYEMDAKPNFSPLSGATHKPGYRKMLLKAWMEFLDTVERMKRRGFKFYLDGIFHHMAPTWDLPKSYTLCGKQMIFDPDGMVRSCPRDPNAILGSIDEPEWITQSLRDRKPKYRSALVHPDTPGECKVCEVGNACQTDCPYERALNGGKNPMCDVIKPVLLRAQELTETGPFHVAFREWYAE